MEGPHGELRAGLADGLRCDDAHSLADIHQVSCGHIRAIALGADAVLTLAGEHRADIYLFDSGRRNAVCRNTVDQLIGSDNHFVRLGIADLVDGNAAPDPVGQGFHHAAAVAQIGDPDTLDILAQIGEAIVFPDDDVMGNVHQAAGQIP